MYMYMYIWQSTCWNWKRLPTAMTYAYFCNISFMVNFSRPAALDSKMQFERHPEQWWKGTSSLWFSEAVTTLELEVRAHLIKWWNMVYSSRSIQNMRKHLVGIQATPPPKQKPFENWPISEPEILTNQKFHGSCPPWNWELAPEKWNAGRDDSFLQVQKTYFRVQHLRFRVPT